MMMKEKFGTVSIDGDQYSTVLTDECGLLSMTFVTDPIHHYCI
jgi:hypothetical protein